MGTQRVYVGLALVFVLMAGPGWSMQRMDWQKVSGIIEPEVHALATSPKGFKEIYFATSNALYHRDFNTAYTRRIVNLPASVHEINNIVIPFNNSDALYLSTDQGAWRYDSSQYRFVRIFESSDEKVSLVHQVIFIDGMMYAATDAGLWIKEEAGANWHKMSVFDGESVYKLAVSPHYIWAAAAQSLWRMERSSKRWEKNRQFSIINNEDTINEDEEQIEAGVRFVKDLVVSHSGNELVLATSRELLITNNEGTHWDNLSTETLPLEDLTRIVLSNLITDKDYYAATTKGVYQFKKGYWQPLYAGLESPIVNDLILDQNNTLWAATDQGVFYLSVGQALANSSLQSPVASDQININTNCSLETGHGRQQSEPSIKQVHQWAIDYAEVHPDKIKSWRTAARRKALLPDLSTGLNRDAAEVFHWDTGANPDNLQKGRGLLDWDVSLSWDLGELIWNNDQTSIDSRSKLMVELRESVLDQVTRLYFERKRLMRTCAPALDVAQDIELRVEELTALLDGYTGGEFSKYIEKPGRD